MKVKNRRNRKSEFKKYLGSFVSWLSYVGIEIEAYYWIQETIDNDAISGLSGSFDDFTFKYLNENDMKYLSNIPGRTEPYEQEEELIRKLRDGRKCYAAMYKGEIAAFSWLNFNRCTNAHNKIDLKSDEAYLFDMYTLNNYRGKNVAPYLRNETYKLLKDMNRTKLYSVTDYFVEPAIRFKQKLKAKFLYLGIYVRIFKRYEKQWKFELNDNSSINRPLV